MKRNGFYKKYLVTSALSDSSTLWGARLLCPWESPGKNNGVGAIPSSRGSFWPRNWTWVSCTAGTFFTTELLGKPFYKKLRQQPERVPWTARRSNQSIPKEISPEYSLEGLMLKLKLQHCGHLMWRTDWLEKTLVLGKTEGGRRRGRQDEVVGWHHRLNGRWV